MDTIGDVTIPCDQGLFVSNIRAYIKGKMDLVREVKVDGYVLRIANPDKLLYPEESITKWDYVLACVRLAPYLLRYTSKRLLTVVRYPDGVHHSYFFQKNAPTPCPDWVNTKKVGGIEYIILDNLPTLVWLANLACLEFHTSFHYYGNERPTELVFDLDPSSSDFAKVVEVALETKKVLERLNLMSYVKTSGASGLQIYIPIKAGYTFEETRQVNFFIAKYLTERLPDLVTMNRRISERGEKVYFDYLQHWRKKTMIAPYSPRATKKATVSTPLTWQELAELSSPEVFTLKTIHERLTKKGDLFSPLLEGPRMDLTEILRFLEQHRIYRL